ncbi:MAG: DUF2225 domain-containing protein [Agathobacter sp.]|nr:DUF2225 domain-containing protein [Agathobacter sp.]
MDNLLSGLGKFGLDENVASNIYGEENVTVKQNEDGTVTKEVAAPKEADFLLLKSIRCPVCDGVFRTTMIKSGRAKRKEPDMDLRPRFEHIDTNKYDVASCPRCGYTAIHRYFPHLSSLQIKLINEGVCAKFKVAPTKPIEEIEVLDYDTAIERYKLALYTTIVKKGQTSEKAYECLKISWLLRGKMEQLAAEDKEKNKEAIEACQKEYDSFYQQAFDGYVKAMSSENYPMSGMDQSTVDLLIAAMAYNLGKYDYASRFVSSLIISRTASANIKKRAHDMKELLLAKLKK